MNDLLSDDECLLKGIAKSALPLQNLPHDFDALLSCIDKCETEIVMIGEATHGTFEFYQYRAELTKKLITEYGFSIVAVEADWPDAYRVNRYVRTNFSTKDKTPAKALGNFQRFPTWLWRNTVMTEFISWLRDYNIQQHDISNECGFYGLDIYSLQNSKEEVIKYLNQVDPKLASTVRKYYGCLDRFSCDPDTYSYKVGLGLSSDCRDAVIKALNDMLKREEDIMAADNLPEEDSYFYAKTNARVVANAENYYRNMINGDNTWNIRDKAMFETLVDLITYMSEKSGRKKKVVVWAHNTHVGDASQTESKNMGEINIAQLVREHFGLKKVFNIGFTTFKGTVTATSKWQGNPEFRVLKEGLPGSYERLFHDSLAYMEHIRNDRFMLVFRSNNPSVPKGILASTDVIQELGRNRIERAIGIVYSADTERESHYFHCKISKQFDAVIHIDTTMALTPLEQSREWAFERNKHRQENEATACNGLNNEKQIIVKRKEIEGRKDI
jgi:erythromycin esterase-like protein